MQPAFTTIPLLWLRTNMPPSFKSLLFIAFLWSGFSSSGLTILALLLDGEQQHTEDVTKYRLQHKQKDVDGSHVY